jgi:hypothetical protein
MKKLKQITEDFQFLEKESTSQDLISRVVQKAVSKPKLKGRVKPMGLEERSKRAKEGDKKRRLAKLVGGVCTRCQKVPPVEGGRLCQGCRDKGAKYVRRSEIKKRGYYDFN